MNRTIIRLAFAWRYANAKRRTGYVFRSFFDVSANNKTHVNEIAELTAMYAATGQY